MMDIENKILVAPPRMRDTRFQKSVIYVIKHDVQGTTGVIINKPIKYPDFPALCREANIVGRDGINPKIHFGGPVMQNAVGVLHTKDYALGITEGLYGKLNFTMDRRIIEDIAKGTMPQKYMITMGFANWDAGQLEAELEAEHPRSKNESWLLVDYDPNLIWQNKKDTLWNACVNISIAEQSNSIVNKFFKD